MCMSRKQKGPFPTAEVHLELQPEKENLVKNNRLLHCCSFVLLLILQGNFRRHLFKFAAVFITAVTEVFFLLS